MSTQEQTPVLSANQLVALNLRRARQLRELTQEQAAARLEPYLGVLWKKATFSAAERSAAEGTRAREFSADELLAFAQAFEVALTYFFLPDEDAPELEVTCGGKRTVGGRALFDAVFPHGFGSGVGPRLKSLLAAFPDEVADQLRQVAWQRVRAAITTAVGPIGDYAADLRRVAEALAEIEQGTAKQVGEELARSAVTRAFIQPEEHDA